MASGLPASAAGKLSPPLLLPLPALSPHPQLPQLPPLPLSGPLLQLLPAAQHSLRWQSLPLPATISPSKPSQTPLCEAGADAALRSHRRCRSAIRAGMRLFPTFYRHISFLRKKGSGVSLFLSGRDSIRQQLKFFRVIVGLKHNFYNFATDQPFTSHNKKINTPFHKFFI